MFFETCGSYESRSSTRLHGDTIQSPEHLSESVLFKTQVKCVQTTLSEGSQREEEAQDCSNHHGVLCGAPVGECSGRCSHSDPQLCDEGPQRNLQVLYLRSSTASSIE